MCFLIFDGDRNLKTTFTHNVRVFLTCHPSYILKAKTG